MPTNDGATTARRRLANEANVTDTVASQMTGADLVYAVLARQSGLTPHDGNRMEQAAAANPRIGSLSVVSGTAAGGTATSLFGEGFKDVTSVTFNGVAGTGLVVVDDNRINVTTPAVAAGVRDVVAVSPDGNGTLVGGFTFV